MTRLKKPFVLGISITLIFCALKAVRVLPLERLDTVFYDIRYRLRGKAYQPQNIVIVGIDDRSIEKVGRWPWDRSKLASLIDSLRNMGAKVIMLDIILSEASKTDGLLARSIKRANNIILPIVFDFKGDIRRVGNNVLEEQAIPFVRKADRFRIFPPLSAKSALLPLDEFSKAARALGHINMFADEDGVLRREVLAIEFGGEFYPSIALQVVRVYLGLPIESLIIEATEGIHLGEIFVPTDFWGRIPIFYYGPQGTFPHLSASDVMDGKVEENKIRGKIVIVGGTAAGLYDLRVTPPSPQMAGAEKHANVIASLLNKDFIKQAPNYANILVIIFSGSLFAFLISRLKAVPGLIAALSFVVSMFLINYNLFFLQKISYDFAYSASNVLFIYFLITAYRYATEERYARKIRAIFSSYVTEKLVNELIKNPHLVRLGGERREVTVLFSDIMGFTSFSEQHSPEEVVAMLNEYLGEMTQIILSWDGTLDKFVGDEIVAFWGAPVKQENHAELAVKCAVDMCKKLKELQKKWSSEGKPVLDAGIGLNTGEVLVGNIGAEGKKMDYTVIGDHVNLGARVEKLTRNYNAHILITEFTLDKIKSLLERGDLSGFTVRRVDVVKVKGKEKPVEIYEISF